MEYRELYRGSRAQAMGNAFVAVADDEQAIFMNPAGLAGIEKFRMNMVNGDFEVSGDALAYARDNVAKFGSVNNALSVGTLNQLQGQNQYYRGQTTPGFVMKNFGVSAIVDGQAALRMRNLALPQIELGYQITNGVQVAGGFSVLSGRRATRRNDLRIGIGGKWLNRRGGYRKIPLSTIVNLSAETLSAIAPKFDSALGVDFGLQYIYTVTEKLKVAVGSAFTDIGDTKFDGGQDPVLSNLSIGTALTYETAWWRAILAYDERHIMETDQDGRKKSHFGLEIALPIVSLYGGLNQGMITYGSSVDIKLVKVTLLSYAEELGTLVGQDSERRYAVKFQVRMGL